MLRNYRDWEVWQRSYRLCIDLYKATASFPQEERFGLTSQIRRAGVSMPSNIAEGYGRRTTADYLRSLYIAYGSTCELQTQVLLATDLGFLGESESSRLLPETGDIERMLKGLMRVLEKKIDTGQAK